MATSDSVDDATRFCYLDGFLAVPTSRIRVMFPTF
jgi:hypothetical protein